MIPKIQVAMKGWKSKIIFKKITQANVNFLTEESEQTIIFEGVVQPLNAQQLMVKPIGERSWQWWMVHTETNLFLQTNDKIIYNGETYKVMGENPYNANGYYYYEMIKDYE